MIKGLTEYDKFKIIHPLPDDIKYTKNDMPIIKKEEIDISGLSQRKILNGSNINSSKNSNNTILINFNYDNILNRIWNDPFKYIPRYQPFYAVCTPDFSIYSNMNLNEIRFNVYKNRYLGCLWQYYGIRVIPTIQWGDERTFDFCFDGVEKGSVVIVSTLGCQNNKEFFLKGFEELKRRIEPELIIVFGKLVPGMTGKFIQYKYEESFNVREYDYEQLALFSISRIIEIKEGGEIYYG